MNRHKVWPVRGSPRRALATLPLPWLAAGLLVAAVVLTYQRVSQIWFICDDFWFLRAARAVRLPGVSAAAVLADAFGDNPLHILRPLVSFLWDGEFGLWDLNSAFYHWVSLLLHIVNALLVYALLRRVFRQRLWPAVATVLWAVYPGNAEAVSWLAGRFDLVSSLFTFAALNLFVGHLRSEGDRCRLALSVVAGLLCVLSKESAVVLPLLVFVCYAFVTGPEAWRKGWLGRGLRLSAPFLVLSVLLMGLRWVQLSELTPRGSVLQLSGPVAALRALAIELPQVLLSPLNLSLASQAVRLAPPILLAVLGVMSLGRVKGRRWLPVAFSAGWFAVSLLPTIDRLGFPQHVLNTRFLYLPSIGFCGAVAWLISEPIRGGASTGIARLRQGAVVGIGVALVAVYALGAYANTAAYVRAGELGRQVVAGLEPTWQENPGPVWVQANAVPHVVDGVYFAVGPDFLQTMMEATHGISGVEGPRLRLDADLPPESERGQWARYLRWNGEEAVFEDFTAQALQAP